MTVKRESLLAFKIAELIKLAQAEHRDAAIKLLTEIESQIFSKKATDANRKLIDAVVAKYRLSGHDVWIEQDPTTIEKIGAGVERLKPGVSVVTCCRNRSENLLKALPTWLAQNKVREIIIVDWTSDIPVADTLSEHRIHDSRIRVVRVENEPRWILSYAFNLGFRLARYDHILKVDADITLKEEFFAKNPVLAGTFVAGDWTKAEKGQEHINGFFFVKTKDLLRVKGFNEYITTYGWDDDDIYSRLTSSGLQRICVDTKSLYHIPHDDASRLDGAVKGDASAWTELNGDPLYKIRTNRYIAMVMPYWNSDRTFVPYRVLKGQTEGLVVERVLQDMPHYVNASMRKNAEMYAAAELLSWRLGPTVFHLENEDLDCLLKIKRLDEISQFDVDLLLKGLSEKGPLKKHSIYLEFDLKNGRRRLDELNKLVSKWKAAPLTQVYVSSYGEGAASYVGSISNDVVQLQCRVRTNGLKLISHDELESVSVLAASGSGCHIKITDELLDALERAGPSLLIKTKKDRLYIDVQHGLGNRLRAYGSAAAIARATGRELVVVWVPDVHCDCRFSDLFDYQGAVVESYSDLPASLIRFNYMEIEADGKKDAEIILEDGSDVLARSAFVLKHSASHWDAECAEIRRLKPSIEVAKLVDGIVLPPNTVGVHVRMEAGKGLDHNTYDSQRNWSKESHDQIHFWREKSHYTAFIKRIDKLIEEDGGVKLFLATDLAENYQIFNEVYGDRLISLPRSVFNRSREQIIFALADVLLLSKARKLLGSTWSSFSELAMRLSETYDSIEMSGRDF